MAQSDTSNFQGNASTYFGWSGQFRYSLAERLFWDNPSNAYL